MCRAWNWQALNKAIDPLIICADENNLFPTVFFYLFCFQAIR